MRAIFSIVSLLVVLAIVGVLAKKQLSSQMVATPPAAGMPAGATPQAQSQQAQQQVKQAVEGAMQARPMPTDDK